MITMTNLPIKGIFYVTATYGQTGKYWATFHKGIDFVCSNLNVYSVIDGVVRVVAYDKNGWGNYVSIGNDKGERFIYCHLKDNSIKVRIGQKVYKGQELAVMGNTGNASGVHLHFQINNANNEPINPKKFFNYDFTKGSYNSEDFVMYKDDMSIPTYAREAIRSLSEKGILRGYDDGTIRATENVSLARLAVIIDRTIKYIEGDK